MEQVCFALPVVDGRSADARAFFAELERQHKDEFDASERRIKINKESWFLQQTPRGDLLIGYMESPDFASALGAFARSTDPFDIWFKERMASVTGVDLNNPPAGPLSDQLSSYEALPAMPA